MGRLIAIFILAIVALPCYGQGPVQQSRPVAAVPVMAKTDLLAQFSQLDIDGPIRITLHKVATAEEVKIVFDTKGDITTKFKADVDAKGVLRISERPDPARTATTEVELYYTHLSSVKVARAQAVFKDALANDLLDVRISGGAIVTLPIEALDVDVECTGRSSVILSGTTRYLTMNVSTAKVDAAKFTTMATTVKASHAADVTVNVTERLEAATATSARLSYKGKPRILRNRTQLFGGDITAIE